MESTTLTSHTIHPVLPGVSHPQAGSLLYISRSLLIPFDDVVHLQGEGNYTYIYTRDKKKYLLSKTLKSFERLLDQATFLRVHKSSIVNMAYIQFDRSQPERSVYLLNGQEVNVSRRRAREITLRLHHYRTRRYN